MTKLSLTKILKEVRGTLGKTLTTFRVWKERQVLEDYPKPTYTRTSKQDQQRTHYRYCCDQWHTLTDEEKASYKEKASKLGLTAFNVFMSECLKTPIAIFKYKVTIDNTQLAQNLTDYQIKLVVSNDATFFSDFNNDHKFMEVYDSDQQTQIPFWVENWDTTNHNATIWIKVPSIPASSRKYIYLKYNPNRTASLSDKASVVEFYDDFDVDLSKWTQVLGTWALENGNLKNTSGGTAIIRTASFTSQNLKVICRAQLYNTVSYNYLYILLRFMDANNFYLFGNMAHENYLKIYKNINGTWTQLAAISNTPDTAYHVYELRISGSRLEFWYDGVLKLTATDTALPNAGYVGFRHYDTNTIIYIDYIYVMKYAYPEPTVSYTKL